MSGGELIAYTVLVFALGALLGTLWAIKWHDANLKEMERRLRREIQLREMFIDATSSQRMDHVQPVKTWRHEQPGRVMLLSGKGN